MKRTVAWMLALTLALGLSMSAQAEDSLVTISAFEQVQDTIGIQQGTRLVVGSTTAPGGYFGTDVWGNNTSDMDIRSLLHGYSTVAWTRTLGLAMDAAAIAGVETQEQPDGSRKYTIHLTPGLMYNDGTPITAKDYVFSLLLTGSPELGEIGGTQKGMNHIVGYEAYQNGQAQGIAGVSLLSDTSFSLHIDGQYLPYFYGLAMLNVTPYPISVIAPGCEVRDEGAGVYIGASAAAESMQGVGYAPGDFSAEMLRVTLLDPETGYEFNPKVTSGPYMLEAYDKASGTVTLVVNEKFRGNYEGQRPHIERIVLKHVTNETAINQLTSGEINLLNKAANGDVITAGRALVSDDGDIQMQNYLRTGFSFIAFACEEGATASGAVRKAISMSLDKDALTAQVAGGAARRVYGYYGLGQWMATYSTDGSDGGAAMNMTEEMAKLDVPQDINGAKALLVSDGWTLNQSGSTFTDGVDKVRYRQGGNGLEALTIRWAKTSGSIVADAIEAALTESLAALGVEFIVEEMPFNEMIRHYYRQEPRTYNMFYLASNFIYVFDPYYDFNTSEAYQGMINKSGLKDDQLMQLALDMRETPSTDMVGYARKWLAFQQRFAEVTPMIPLYSNVYFDFYNRDLQGYDIASHSGWGLASLYAWMDGQGGSVAVPEGGETVEPAPEGDEVEVVVLN